MENTVELIGYYGSDELHALSAWTSTSRDLTPEKVTRIPALLKRLAENGHHCYDNITEILTDDGWKLFKDITYNSKVLAVNIKDLSAEFEQPKDIYSNFYNEPMYYVKGQQLDLAVTKGHRMVISQKRKSNGSDYGTVWEFQTSNEVSGKNRKYLKACHIKDYGHIFSSNTAKLIGFFIGDGSLEPSGRIIFHIKKKRKIEYLKSLGFIVKENKNDVYVIDDKKLGLWLKEHCYSKDKDKKLPDNYLTFSNEDTKNILDGLKNSDGTIKRDTWVYYTCSTTLKEQLETLVSLHGGVFTESTTTPLRKNHNKLFRLNYSNRVDTEITNQKSRKGNDTDFWKIYTGKVYCVTVSTGAILVRRNGHIVVSGNTPFEKSMLHFLVTVDTATHIHLLKHRIGVSINGESARYKEFKEEKFYIPADWPEGTRETLKTHMEESYILYHRTIEYLVAEGIDRKRAKESARFFLPYSHQIIMDVSFNWRSFNHFLSLRRTAHAQLEVKRIAEKMLQLVKDIPGNPFKHTIVAFYEN